MKRTMSCATVSNDINIYLKNPNIEQRKEDVFFRASATECAEAHIFESLRIKTQSILIFDEIAEKYRLSFVDSLLELGAGYGWLSTYIKRTNPDLRIVSSDPSYEAVRKMTQYEDFFGVKLDGKWVMEAEDIVFGDNSFSNILFFASFHHVQDPKAAISECARVLKPGGELYLMMEPSCPLWLRPMYNIHQERKDVQENNYSLGQYRKLFSGAGLLFRNYNYKDFRYRWSTISILYYVFLSAFYRLDRYGFLPCSQVIIGRKTSGT